MSRYLALTLLMLISGFSADASKLKGVVRLNGLYGPPVSNVTVGAVAGASPNATDSLGLFTLEFPNKRPGETVQLVIRKEGFEVVNDLQLLEVSLPVDPDAKPVTIIICAVGNREEMARRFYGLKTVDAIEESFRRKAEKANSEEMAQLRRERDQALAAAERAAEELAKTKPGQTSELYRTAMRLFLDGETEQALKALDEQRLEELVRSARERKAEADEEIQEASQAWLLKARLLTTQFQFSEADRAYQAAIEASPESFNANLAYARFSLGLNRYLEARAAYSRCLQLARRSGNEADIARTLNEMGILDFFENRMEEARKEYEEALKIERELAKKIPMFFMQDVAATLSNLGNVDLRQNLRAKARREYEEALKIRREATQFPWSDTPGLAAVLDSLANLDTGENLMEDARKEYEEALKIHRKLVQEDSAVYLPSLAATLGNLGILDSKQNRLEEAREELEEALKYHRQSAPNNPEANLPAMAKMLDNLGIVYLQLNLKEDARKDCEEALKIRRELAKKNPVAYLPEVAKSLDNLGRLDYEDNRIEDSDRALEEALSIDRELALKDRETNLPELALTLNSSGVLHAHKDRKEQARKEYEEALTIYRELAQKNPDSYLPYVANTLGNLGYLDFEQGRTEEARKEYEESLNIYQRFAERNPGQYQPSVDNVLRTLKDWPVH